MASEVPRERIYGNFRPSVMQRSKAKRMAPLIWIALAWMWLSGAATMWLLLDELLVGRIIFWRTLLGSLLWPLTWPVVLSFAFVMWFFKSEVR